jgi:hypothetical protein
VDKAAPRPVFNAIRHVFFCVYLPLLPPSRMGAAMRLFALLTAVVHIWQEITRRFTGKTQKINAQRLPSLEPRPCPS